MFAAPRPILRLSRCACLVCSCLALLAPSAAFARETFYATPTEAVQAQLPSWSGNRFADVAESPLSAEEASRVALGPLERSFELPYDRPMSSASLFASMRRADDYVVIPLMLGTRRIATFGVERQASGWSVGAVGTESKAEDATRAELLARLQRQLDGPPQQVRSANVAGSSWLFAKRGNLEASGLLAYNSYGTWTGGSPKLPKPGTVLSSQQFRSLFGRIHDGARRREEVRVSRLVATALLLLLFASSAIVLVVLLRSRRRSLSPDPSNKRIQPMA